MTTLFLCAKCGDGLELENYQARAIQTYAQLLKQPLVVHCWKCALEVHRHLTNGPW